MIALMQSFGFSSFHVMGHDRGARVAYRMALDHPEVIEKMVLLDIVSTYDMYENTNRDFVKALVQWLSLIHIFTKEFNARTADQDGMIIPVVITVYADRSFSFITKTPPAAVLLKKACKLKSGSGVPNRTKVATIKKSEVQKIAELKMPDLNAASIEACLLYTSRCV